MRFQIFDKLPVLLDDRRLCLEDEEIWLGLLNASSEAGHIYTFGDTVEPGHIVALSFQHCGGAAEHYGKYACCMAEPLELAVLREEGKALLRDGRWVSYDDLHLKEYSTLLDEGNCSRGQNCIERAPIGMSRRSSGEEGSHMPHLSHRSHYTQGTPNVQVERVVDRAGLFSYAHGMDEREQGGTSRRKRVAFIYRYSVNDHDELYPVMPGVLRKLGESYDVLYIGLKCREQAEKYEFPGVRYRCLPWTVNRKSSADKWFKAILYYITLPFFALYLRGWRADVIWVEESIPIAGRLTQIFSGRPLVLTMNDFFVEVYKETYPWLKVFGKLVFSMDRKAWRIARGLVTRTESMRQYLIEQGAKPNRVKVVRDAVMPDVFVPAEAGELRKRLGFADEDIVVGQHGILHPNKGIPRVLKWMVPVMKEDPHLKFLVVGEGPDLATLKTIVKKNELEKQAVFVGWLPDHKEVSAHLNACDIGLAMRIGQFSDHFHVTGAVKNCMMCGLPVLAARLRGIEEVVREGEEGCLFGVESAIEFREKLEKLRADKWLRKQMGEKARQKAVAEFDVVQVAKKAVAALESFL